MSVSSPLKLESEYWITKSGSPRIRKFWDHPFPICGKEGSPPSPPGPTRSGTGCRVAGTSGIPSGTRAVADDAGRLVLHHEGRFAFTNFRQYVIDRTVGFVYD